MLKVKDLKNAYRTAKEIGIINWEANNEIL
jgi:hypothetical protein